MVTIPTFQRQRGIPATTGVPAPPVVLINNPVAESVVQFSKTMGVIGNNMLEAQRRSHVSQAVVNATLKLSQLEVSSAALPGITAMQQFPVKTQTIYDEASSGLVDPRARAAFDQKWFSLAAKSRIVIQSSATNKAYSEMAGNLELALNSLVKGLDISGAPINGQQAIALGVEMITDAINTNVIEAKAGALRKLKFVQEVSEEGVIGWLNNQGQDLMRALGQMDKGEIKDSNIQNMWKALDEKTKARLRARAITSLSQSLTFEDKEEARKEEMLERDAKKLMFEFYALFPEVTTPGRRGEILKNLYGNTAISLTTYRTMSEDYAGRTDRFDDRNKSLALRMRIIRTPWDVTLDEIITSGLSFDTIDELLRTHKVSTEARLSRAREILAESPIFVPVTKIDEFFNARLFNAAQAEIWTTVLEEDAAFFEAGKTYDAVARVKDLIDKFEATKDGPSKVNVEIPNPNVDLTVNLGDFSNADRERLSAQMKLRELGINRPEDMSVDWESRNMYKLLLTPEKIKNIRDLIDIAFGKQ